MSNESLLEERSNEYVFSTIRGRIIPGGILNPEDRIITLDDTGSVLSDQEDNDGHLSVIERNSYILKDTLSDNQKVYINTFTGTLQVRLNGLESWSVDFSNIIDVFKANDKLHLYMNQMTNYYLITYDNIGSVLSSKKVHQDILYFINSNEYYAQCESGLCLIMDEKTVWVKNDYHNTNIASHIDGEGLLVTYDDGTPDAESCAAIIAKNGDIISSYCESNISYQAIGSNQDYYLIIKQSSDDIRLLLIDHTGVIQYDFNYISHNSKTVFWDYNGRLFYISMNDITK